MRVTVHYQRTGVKTMCGMKVFPHDQPTRMVLKDQVSRLREVTCDPCRASYTWQAAVSSESPEQEPHT